MVDTVKWNGKCVERLPPEHYEPKIRLLKSLGLDALMLTGYVTVEPTDFDVDEETKRMGDLLRSLGMCAAQHHGLCATFAPPGESQDEVVERIVRCARWTANLNSKVLAIHPGNTIAHYATSDTKATPISSPAHGAAATRRRLPARHRLLARMRTNRNGIGFRELSPCKTNVI